MLDYRYTDYIPLRRSIDTFENILPEVLVGEIFNFISLKNLAKCNKYYFNEYYLKKNKKKEKIKQSYFRFLLRNDMNFISRSIRALG